MPLAFALLGASLAAAAPEPKPVIEIETDRVLITVTIDPALDSFPGLVADCLAQERAAAADTVATAEKEQALAANRDDLGPRWEFETSYSLLSVVPDHYVSVGVWSYGFMGGAHGSSSDRALLWDLTQQRRANVAAFFTETSADGSTMKALTRLVLIALIVEKMHEGSVEPWGMVEGPPSLEQMAQADPFLHHFRISLDAGLELSDQPGKSSGLTFSFDQCDVEPCVAGPVSVFVPWREFAPHLAPEGASVFGGDRLPTRDPVE